MQQLLQTDNFSIVEPVFEGSWLNLSKVRQLDSTWKFISLILDTYKVPIDRFHVTLCRKFQLQTPKLSSLQARIQDFEMGGEFL